MKPKIEINLDSSVPVYKQLVQEVLALSKNGGLKKGDLLPSMNELAGKLNISKETVKKAYSILRNKGVIESSHGKGFYVTNKKSDKISILALFDKISTYKQELYASFTANIGTNAEMTIHLHNQDIALFQHFVEENLDNFDYYLVTPHFPLVPAIQKKVLKIIKKIPNRKLLLIDRYLEQLPGNFGSVYQDFENDIYDGLGQGLASLKKYGKLNVLSMQSSMYAPLIEAGITRFCLENQVPFQIHRCLVPAELNKNEAFLIVDSQLDCGLLNLVREAKSKGMQIGSDIGIICYNESPLNDIILDGLTVFSTDFRQMGELAAKMINEKTFRKTKCDFQLIRRSTF